MKAAITGSSGLIGGCLFERLSGDHEVFGLDLMRGPYANVVGDVVIHCAAQTNVAESVRDPLFDAQDNVRVYREPIEALYLDPNMCLRELVYWLRGMAVAKVEIKGAYLDSGVAKTLARGQNINRAAGNSV